MLFFLYFHKSVIYLFISGLKRNPAFDFSKKENNYLSYNQIHTKQLERGSLKCVQWVVKAFFLFTMLLCAMKVNCYHKLQHQKVFYSTSSITTTMFSYFKLTVSCYVHRIVLIENTRTLLFDWEFYSLRKQLEEINITNNPVRKFYLSQVSTEWKILANTHSKQTFGKCFF